METNQQQKGGFLAGSIIAAALILGGSYIYGSGLKSGTVGGLANVQNQGAKAENQKPVNLAIGDSPVLGDATAPVTIFEFGDFQCPFCKKIQDESNLKIREEYIKTGKVKIVYKHFPLYQIHPSANPAALASECAKEQGKFWTYHDALFENQANLSTLNFTDLAGSLGMDKSKFKSCYDSAKYSDNVKKDVAEGTVAGVSGTPASFINGKALMGAVPYATFKAAIEEALAKK
ncbi:MAG: DsbA family protein [Candidatus Pacebacteria bacterium]|nr:DsbA family protein [Candidatus Paceibacterota bacterium]